MLLRQHPQEPPRFDPCDGEVFVWQKNATMKQRKTIQVEVREKVTKIVTWWN